MTAIAANIAHVREQLVRACDQAGRDPRSVRLIAVSKTHAPDAVSEAIAAGVRDFGENRVEEAASKIPQVALLHPEIPINWHMIGHIQSRKAKSVATLFGTVHSVDSLKLALRLAAARPEGARLRILLECNVSGEPNKDGFPVANWQTDEAALNALIADLQAINLLGLLEVRGLMTMAPIVSDMEQARPVFRSLRRLRDTLQERTGLALPELSMGMTDDYSVAVAEGATIVRVGRAIFGQRQA